MRLPADAHRSQPWRIHALTPEFGLEDVWRLPMTVPADEFSRLVEQFEAIEPSRSSSAIVRALFALRFKIGELFGWDDGAAWSTLLEAEDEWAAEISNKTVDGILHLGRLPDGTVQMAVLVRPNGLFGQLYMAAIRPFRHLFVYPVLLRDSDRRWRSVHA